MFHDFPLLEEIEFQSFYGIDDLFTAVVGLGHLLMEHLRLGKDVVSMMRFDCYYFILKIASQLITS